MGHVESRMDLKISIIKEPGSCNRKQTCCLHNLCCCQLMAIVFCTEFGGWGKSTIKLLLKSTNISAIVQQMSVSFVFFMKFKSPSSK